MRTVADRARAFSQAVARWAVAAGHKGRRLAARVTAPRSHEG
jgi:hypothetical protein